MPNDSDSDSDSNKPATPSEVPRGRASQRAINEEFGLSAGDLDDSDDYRAGDANGAKPSAKNPDLDFGELTPGYVVADRFRVERLVGKGGMGAVYEATQLGLNRKVALKVMHGKYALNQQQRDRFVREARVASKLSHATAVEIYDFGRAEGGLFIAMELLTGVSLADYLEKTDISVETAVDLVQHIAEGLDAAHDINLVHRDLKPDNIFLVNEDPTDVRIIDFGLAFIFAEDGDLGRLTQEAMVSGTPAYVAPETAQALEVGPPADIYALGIIAFLMLTGELPFNGNSAQIIAAQVFQIPAALKERGVRVHADLDDLVVRMLAKNPEVRPTASQVLETIRVVDKHPGERSIHQGSPARSGTDRFGVPAGVIAGRHARTIREPSRDLDTVDYEQGLMTERRNVAWVGDVPDAMRVALAMRAIDVVVVSPEDATDGFSDVQAAIVDTAARALVCIGASNAVPIICTVSTTKSAEMAELIRAGITDVLVEPLDPADVARKVSRAIQKARRKPVSSRRAPD